MDSEKAYIYCIKLLSIGDRTASEIIQKLKQKNYPDDVIDETISKLKDYGYINDAEYVDRWIKFKSDQPGMSKKSMYYKLMNKGIDKELLDIKFDEANIKDYDTALACAEKKLKALKGDKKQNRAKLFSYLAGKGYGYDTCNRVVNELLEED